MRTAATTLLFVLTAFLCLSAIFYGATRASPRALQTDRAGRIRKALQPILEESAARYNISISYAFYDAETTVELAAGIQDHERQVYAKTSDLYPMGSATKPWTAAAVLELAERGVLHLDDPVSTHIDAILRREANASVRDLFGDKLQNVTIRHLLSMRSGIPDYNDRKIEDYTFSHPTRDIDPYELIRTVNEKELLFKPGTGGSYSSIGYVLLGLVLAQSAHPAEPSWLTYDQLSVLPAALRNKSTAFFPLRGPCAQYADKGVVHQYAPIVSWKLLPPGLTVQFRDIFADSCLNGWTCGNMAARPLDLASFFWHLLHRGPENTAPILPPASLAAMQEFKPLTVGFAPGLEYGLGLMAMGWPKSTNFIGHAGADWGSGAPTAGYDTVHHFGLAVAMNSACGMSCSDGDFSKSNFYASNCIACRVQVGTYLALGLDVDVDKACARPCGASSLDDASESARATARRLFNLDENSLIRISCK
jgi:CubicO group peptidase (beta-lactamase class C family)